MSFTSGDDLIAIESDPDADLEGECVGRGRGELTSKRRINGTAIDLIHGLANPVTLSLPTLLASPL